MRCIGVFGGTFDPVHFGHLRTAYELLVRLELAEVRFVPCAVAPHRRQPITDSATRVRMLEAAIADVPEFVIDTRELERAGPSYTVDTLESLRTEYPDEALCLLLGMDAFLGLPGWHEWERLLDLAHIVVANRPRLERNGTVYSDSMVTHTPMITSSIGSSRNSCRKTVSSAALPVMLNSSTRACHCGIHQSGAPTNSAVRRHSTGR